MMQSQRRGGAFRAKNAKLISPHTDLRAEPHCMPDEHTYTLISESPCPSLMQYVLSINQKIRVAYRFRAIQSRVCTRDFATCRPLNRFAPEDS